MNATPLDAFVVVLVEPQGPANVGSVARAMKNMGFSRLRLVSPGEWYGPEARKMSMKGRDVLEAAELFESLADAVADCGHVVATTRRGGPMRSGAKPPRELARDWIAVGAASRVALASGGSEPPGGATPLAPQADLEAMYEQMRPELERIGFLQGSHADHIMFALRQMFGRAGLSEREVRIIRGIFQQMRWYIEEGSLRERFPATPPTEV